MRTNNTKPHLLSHYHGVEEEHWQSHSYLPSITQARSDKMKTKELDDFPWLYPIF